MNVLFKYLHRFNIGLWWCLAFVLSSAVAAPLVHTPEREPLRRVSNEAFGTGEELNYTVRYKFITAGTGSFKILPAVTDYKGAPCYDVQFEVQSLKSLEWIYKVRNVYRTLIDIHGVFPWYFEQHNREGNYKRDFWAELDQTKHVAKTSEGEFSLEPFTHDIVSAFFFVRTMNFKTAQRGDVIELKNFADRELHTLNVRILGRQIVRVEAGLFQCVVVEPLVMEGGLFKNEGRILLWLSDDDRKIPVKVSSKILIGSIDVELTSYKGLRGAVTAKIGESSQK